MDLKNSINPPFLGLQKRNESITTTYMIRGLLSQTKRAYNDNEIRKLKRLIPLIILIVILACLPVIVVSDTSPTDSNIPDNEITTHQTEASNSSASATITITMTGVLTE